MGVMAGFNVLLSRERYGVDNNLLSRTVLSVSHHSQRKGWNVQDVLALFCNSCPSDKFRGIVLYNSMRYDNSARS